MRKFKCGRCAKTCTLLLDENLAMPRCCIYGNRESLWCVIKEDSEENAHTLVNSEQLPDWVKVGELAHCSIMGIYYEIVDQQGNTISIRQLGYDDIIVIDINKILKTDRPARKRPFNEKEMKALVGKIIEFKNGDTTLATGYSEEFDEGVEGHGYGIWTCWGWSIGAKELMNECTIDGKPCYKLEHLNEKGEWAE